MRTTHFVRSLILVVAIAATLAQARMGGPARLAPAQATSATFYATADTFVSENAPDINYDADPRLDVRQDEFLAESFALLRFDLASIPAGSVVNSAQFYSYVRDAGSFADAPKLS